MTRRIIATAVVLVLLFAGAGYLVTRPPDFHDFRTGAVEAAQAAHDAVRTSALSVDALVRHNSTTPFVTVVLDNAMKSVASARSSFDELAPPDGYTARIRDELAPMLTDAVRQLGDVSHAVGDGDPARIREAAQGLGALGDRLDGFLGEHA